MQNPAVLLSWAIFQNPFPHFEIQHLLGNTQGILIYFSANEEGWDREKKKKKQVEITQMR